MPTRLLLEIERQLLSEKAATATAIDVGAMKRDIVLSRLEEKKKKASSLSENWPFAVLNAF